MITLYGITEDRRVYVEAPVHHAPSPSEVLACGAVPDETAKVIYCSTRWEHVTCPVCKARQPLGCKVNIMAIKLPEEFQGITGNLHALAAVPLSQTNLVWTAIKSDWDPFGAVAAVGTVPPIGSGWPGVLGVDPAAPGSDRTAVFAVCGEEPAPAPEPEQPQRSEDRTEGDDLLDFFRGDR